MAQVIGMDKVLKMLEKAGSKEKYQEALGQACALVERSAKQKAPKDSGALRGSITSEVVDLEGVVFTPLEYAPYVEYGTGLYAESGGRTDVPWFYVDEQGQWHITSGQHPQPYMRPALEENREEIIRMLKGALKK